MNIELPDLPDMPDEAPRPTASVATLGDTDLPDAPPPESYEDKPLREVKGTPSEKFGTLLDLSLDNIGEILQYQPTPGADGYVDIIKVKAQLSTAILNTAARAGDKSLAQQTDDKMGQILEEIKKLQADYGTTLLPAQHGQLLDAEPLSLEEQAPDTQGRGGRLATVQCEELSRTLERVPLSSGGRG